MKFCKDCLHYKRTPGHFGRDICSSPALGVNPVSGEPITRDPTWSRLRMYECKPEALLFEPKLHEEKTSVTIIPFWKKLFKLKG